MVHRATGARAHRGTPRQRLIPSLEIARRREHWFKGSILVLTVVTVLGLLAGLPVSRSGAVALALRLKGMARVALGLGPSRAEIDADTHARRAKDIARTREIYRGFFTNEASPDLQRILRAARMAPEDVLLRWANVDWTMLFSPLVFQADDCGRAYRMRPRTRSFWLVNHTLTRGLTSFFFLPDTLKSEPRWPRRGPRSCPSRTRRPTPGAAAAAEPDLDAALRSWCSATRSCKVSSSRTTRPLPSSLRRFLATNWGQPVSVLNTGHIGYSPEQCYHTLANTTTGSVPGSSC